jgi:hypothetical protein
MTVVASERVKRGWERCGIPVRNIRCSVHNIHEIMKFPSLSLFSSSFFPFILIRILVEVEESNTVVPSEMKETRRGNGESTISMLELCKLISRKLSGNLICTG